MSLITITSGIGSSGMTIAQLVSNELKLDLYDDQRLQQEAVDIGILLEEVKNVYHKEGRQLYLTPRVNSSIPLQS